MRHIISKYLTYYLYDVDVQYKRSKWPFKAQIYFTGYKAQIYFTGYKWMFLNDNQIYVTTKFMHSTQILVSVLAKKTFVCTLSASISDAASSPPQKPYISRLTDKALRISARASHIINQLFIRSNLFSGDYQRNGTNMKAIVTVREAH